MLFQKKNAFYFFIGAFPIHYIGKYLLEPQAFIPPWSFVTFDKLLHRGHKDEENFKLQKMFSLLWNQGAMVGFMLKKGAH